MAMLFVLSSMSRIPSPPGDLSYYDVHLLAYAGLSVLTVRALARRQWQHVTWRVVLGAIAISTAYGVSDEYHQRFVPGRTFELLDMAADAIGSVIGASAAGAWSIIRRRFETRDVL